MQVQIRKLIKEDGDYLLLETGDKIILNPLEAETTAQVQGVGSALVEAINITFQEITATVKAAIDIASQNSFVRSIEASVEASVEIFKGITITAIVTGSAEAIKGTLNKSMHVVGVAKAKLKDMFYKTKYRKQNDNYTKKY